MSFVDVFVGNFTIIDFDLYDLWLRGLSVNEAVAVLQRKGVLQSSGAGIDELVSDTKDNFRLFGSLEQHLKCPPQFGEQHLLQIDQDTQKMLIEKYYQFDDAVIREILGKKLSSRNRKDLDDVNEKTKVPLRSCRRQFDNVKRVFRTVEDMMGSLVKNIKTHYLLSEELANNYATVVFMANHRFETGKKKVSHLTFDDYSYCAVLMIANWSYSAVECDSHQDQDVDLDRNFLQNLRDLKLLLEKEYMDELKNYVINTLKTTFTRKKLSDLEENFKNMSKAIINIAYGLNHSKEVRDFFLDVTEKLIEPMILCGWTSEDMSNFLSVFKDSGHRLPIFKSMPSLVTVWERYMNTFIKCTIKMYHV